MRLRRLTVPVSTAAAKRTLQRLTGSRPHGAALAHNQPQASHVRCGVRGQRGQLQTQQQQLAAGPGWPRWQTDSRVAAESRHPPSPVRRATEFGRQLCRRAPGRAPARFPPPFRAAAARCNRARTGSTGAGSGPAAAGYTRRAAGSSSSVAPFGGPGNETAGIKTPSYHHLHKPNAHVRRNILWRQTG